MVYVVIGQEKGKVAEAAIGPFDQLTDATEFRDLLASVTTAEWTVLHCNTPGTKPKPKPNGKRKAA